MLYLQKCFTFNESDFLPKPPQAQFTKFALEAIKVVSYANIKWTVASTVHHQ